MFLIRRIITAAFALIGSLASIIVLALINALSHSGLTGGQVVLYGLIAGLVLGVIASYLLINYVIRKTKKFLFNKFANSLGKFSFLKKI